MDAEGLSVTCLLAVKLCPSAPLCYAIPNGLVSGTQKPVGELEAVVNGVHQCISYVRKSTVPLISTLNPMFKTAFTENLFESYHNIL